MAATLLRGSLCVIVHEEGAWTLRFSRGEVEVEETIDFDADLVVTFSPASFADFAQGKALDLDSEDPVCMGDATLLERLGRVLSPPQEGVLSAQLAFRKVT